MGRIRADCATKLSHRTTQYHESAANASAAKRPDYWEEAGARVVERYLIDEVMMMIGKAFGDLVPIIWLGSV